MLLKTVAAVASLMIATVCGKVKSAHFGLKVDGTDMYTVSYARYDYVQLSMEEGKPTEFRIRTLDKKPITSFRITPQKLPISAKAQGNELVFSVKKAHYLIVKINDKKEFVILADPLEKDVPSPSGKNVFNVLNFGADATGATVTKGIQAAMDAAAKTPGSVVYVPPGLYSMGNLLLRNRTSLYLAGGSVLRFTGNPADYKTLFKKSDLHPGTWWIQTEFDSFDIKVYGRGTIDGNGRATRENKYMADLLVPAGTTNFRCDGVLVRDSSFWAVTPIQVTEATITNIKILNRFDVTQDDGIDVIESTKVRVRRAIAIGKDDSFSTKTWPADTGTTVPYPYAPRAQRDVFFDDCVAWSDTYGYKLGQGVHEDQEAITFQNGVVYDAAVGFGIDHKFGSATARRIAFKNMDVERLHGNAHGQAAWMTVYVQNTGRGVGPVRDVWVKNVRARARGSRPAFLQGYNASAMVSGVTLTNIRMGADGKRATSLKEMNILETNFSENIKVVN
ncbi:pectin lyase-like protein [Durotheca rogersii]|uniref:pectin lyase-like protein n=1 Tax=Durotheca rogersii TaxID=419775 RepID=UPI00221EE375|nr:pectin lyase-like protein [Durotheca rogersii]KAI5867526.1 pectin lyase-like protein [Durotheca rogersii]